MPNLISIIGYGAVGRATALRLRAAGHAVRVIQRHRPSDLPVGVEFRAADTLSLPALTAALAGSSQIVLAIGFAYSGAVWQQSWPPTMENVLAVAEINQARVVFIDNLYMYGPQTNPLHEDMPLTSAGVKPAVRATLTRLWQTAHHSGRVKVTALRAPDFYGPGSGKVSHFGDFGLGALARGKAATLVIPADMPHDFAYVPDIARAAESLLTAPDDAFGQAWHVPSAPTRTARHLLAIGADALGMPLKLSVIPRWLLPLLALGMPDLRGFLEMRFQWDRPYTVDATKFATRFWGDATPFESGVAETALSYRQSPKDSQESASPRG